MKVYVVTEKPDDHFYAGHPVAVRLTQTEAEQYIAEHSGPYCNELAFEEFEMPLKPMPPVTLRSEDSP